MQSPMLTDETFPALAPTLTPSLLCCVTEQTSQLHIIKNNKLSCGIDLLEYTVYAWTLYHVHVHTLTFKYSIN